MSNKKNKPASGTSAAGKNNIKNKKPVSASKQEKEKARAIKQAQKIKEDIEKEKELREKKSREIQKRREDQAKEEQKANEKAGKKEARSNKKKAIADKFRNLFSKIKHYTSKDFLKTINYKRIVCFIIIPIVVIVVASIVISQTVTVNVPLDIRTFEFNGRLESDTIAQESVFNSQQQSVMTDALHTKGSGKFSFYMNSEIIVDDDNRTESLCFGNPKGNECVLIATIYDSNGNVIYRSLGLEPGMEINNATMFNSLPYGTHNVKVCVNAYDGKSFDKIGSQYAKIKLAVGVEADDS